MVWGNSHELRVGFGRSYRWSTWFFLNFKSFGSITTIDQSCLKSLLLNIIAETQYSQAATPICFFLHFLFSKNKIYFLLPHSTLHWYHQAQYEYSQSKTSDQHSKGCYHLLNDLHSIASETLPFSHTNGPLHVKMILLLLFKSNDCCFCFLLLRLPYVCFSLVGFLGGCCFWMCCLLDRVGRCRNRRLGLSCLRRGCWCRLRILCRNLALLRDAGYSSVHHT